MHEGNRSLRQLAYISQEWQAWDCCSENRNEQSRRGEWETCGSSVLLCLFPAQLVLCTELRSLGVKDSLPDSLCCSSWPGAPMVQPDLLSAPSLTPSSQVNGQVQEFALQQLLITPNISVFNCAIETSALKCSHQFCLGKTETTSSALLLASLRQDLGTRVVSGCHSAGIPWGCSLDITSGQEDKAEAFQT